MRIELSDTARALINETLSDRGARGPKSPFPSDVVFIAAAELAISGNPWRELDEVAGNRNAAANRVKRWVSSGELTVLNSRVNAVQIQLPEIDLIISLSISVAKLASRVRSAKGRPWTAKNERKNRKLHDA